MASRRAFQVVGLVFLLMLGAGALAADDPTGSSGREIPESLAPFEYLIGAWKGAGVPVANKTRGWEESHAWAWKFEKGSPVGMSVAMTGSKVVRKGQLTFDATKKQYQLMGEDASGKPVTFAGELDRAGKQLTLERAGANASGAKQKIILRPNANFVRYTLRVEEQEEGAPKFKPLIEAGLTKEGESFAAGSTAGDAPKCIVTGGAATMSVSYKGTTYPLCCSGCRDEFNENPEKYIKKLALRKDSAAGAAKPASASTGKDDGSFAGVEESSKAANPAGGAMKKKSAATSAAPAPAKETAKAGTPAKSTDISRAASLLRLGQNLEKTGKTGGALGYYKKIVKDFPDTPSAKTAAERIKALGE